MPRLSIVIPCIQEAGYFEATLAAVLQNRPNGCEVLVVQPRTYDDPYELKDEVRFVQAQPDATLVDLINAGIESAAGEIVHLLSCDIEVGEGWTERALAHFNDPLVGCVSPLVTLRDSSQVVSRGVHYGSGGVRKIRRTALARRRAQWRHVCAPTLSAGMYRRQAVLEAGGFCAGVGADLADVDLGLLLQEAGYRCVHEESSSLTTEFDNRAQALSFAHGRAAERLFWRHTAPSEWTAILLAHPFLWITECICNLHRPQIVLQMMGRIRGFLERASHQRHLPKRPRNGAGSRPMTLPLEPPSGSNCNSRLNSRAAA